MIRAMSHIMTYELVVFSSSLIFLVPAVILLPGCDKITPYPRPIVPPSFRFPSPAGCGGHEKGIISMESGIAITDAGLKYLEGFTGVREFLEIFGFLRIEKSSE